MRGRSLRGHGALYQRRLLPLQPLPETHRYGLLRQRPGPPGRLPAAAGRRGDQVLQTPRRASRSCSAATAARPSSAATPCTTSRWRSGSGASTAIRASGRPAASTWTQPSPGRRSPRTASSASPAPAAPKRLARPPRARAGTPLPGVRRSGVTGSSEPVTLESPRGSGASSARWRPRISRPSMLRF